MRGLNPTAAARRALAQIVRAVILPEKYEELLEPADDMPARGKADKSGRPAGLGNAISDGHLVVYFPHMLVHPDFHRQGVGRAMMKALMQKYAGFHQQMLTADGDAVAFYRSMGFERAGRTAPMWVYAGTEH